MAVIIQDLSIRNEENLQHIESYVFVRQKPEGTERVTLSSPGLDLHRDSLGHIRPVSILYSLIGPETADSTSHFVYRTTPFLTTDGEMYGLTIIKPAMYFNFPSMQLKLDERYRQDTQACIDIMRECQNEFGEQYRLSRLNLDRIIENFNRVL